MPRSVRTNATQTSQSNEPHRTSLPFTQARMRRPDARRQSERERLFTENKDPKPKKTSPEKRNPHRTRKTSSFHQNKTTAAQRTRQIKMSKGSLCPSSEAVGGTNFSVPLSKNARRGSTRQKRQTPPAWQRQGLVTPLSGFALRLRIGHLRFGMG